MIHGRPSTAPRIALAGTTAIPASATGTNHRGSGGPDAAARALFSVTGGSC